MTLLLAARFVSLVLFPISILPDRFPPTHAVSAALEFNHAYQRGLRLRLDLETRADLLDWYADALEESQELAALWQTVRCSRWAAAGGSYQQRQLAWLLDTLGPEAFYRGDLPTPVPTWRFFER